jgi:cytidylate kinase
MSSELRIAISGKSGCGNTTVSRQVANTLGLRVINYTFKDLARERGISFESLCALAERDTQYDLYLDRRQVELAREDGFVLGSRLAVWLLRGSAFCVYLKVRPEIRAARIARREGMPLETALADTAARDKRDHDRYRNLYGWDIDRYEFVDLVVDAESLDQNGVTAAIVEAVRRKPAG